LLLILGTPNVQLAKRIQANKVKLPLVKSAGEIEKEAEQGNAEKIIPDVHCKAAISLEEKM